jgi:hypothetical protein
LFIEYVNGGTMGRTSFSLAIYLMLFPVLFLLPLFRMHDPNSSFRRLRSVLWFAGVILLWILLAMLMRGYVAT